MNIDLHIHTTYSDGILSPKEVIDLAIKKNLDIISITDHDTAEGVSEALEYSKDKNIILIPGIEFSCIEDKEEIHILGYNFDHTNERLKKLSNEIGESRINRNKKIIEKLNDIGLEISFEEVKSKSKDGVMGRPHIAEVMIDKDYVKTIGEAFDSYIGTGKSCYVERYNLSIKNAIDIIHDLGGVAVLAHPVLLNDYSYIDHCIKMGIDGIEVIHSKHNKKDIRKFKKICRQNNIMSTAGSDCHGHLIGDDYLLGNFTKQVDNLDFLKL